MTSGAVAAGSPLTVEAGLAALRAGGNAADAAIAASLMAGVAEALLTGLGGGGIATLRMGGQVEVLDLFSDVPGRGGPAEGRPALRHIDVDFGPAVQRFHFGPASVAVPALPGGLWALHQKYGRLDMARLVEPAARAAEQGVPVTPGFAQVCGLLWPILGTDDALRALFSREGRPLRAGDVFTNPDLAGTLRAYAEQGPALFSTGAVGQAILAALGAEARLNATDLAAWQPVFRAPICYHYRDATVWLPPPSSVAGLLVAQALRALEDHGPMPEPLGAAQVRSLAHALRRVEGSRGPTLHGKLFQDGFVDGFLLALAPQEDFEAEAHGQAPTGEGRGGRPRLPRQPGNTTHISVVDADGNAVAITHSLGETAGLVVPGTGLLLNNFLGESDVYPEDAALPPGSRLLTMCCPSLLEIGDQIYALGSGGSSRIRSALLHGIVYLTDHGLDPRRAVTAPRCHVEGGRLYVEADRRPPGTLEALAAGYPNMNRFDSLNLFFGGLHIAGSAGGHFSGAGDPRRSGTFGTTD